MQAGNFVQRTPIPRGGQTCEDQEEARGGTLTKYGRSLPLYYAMLRNTAVQGHSIKFR